MSLLSLVLAALAYAPLAAWLGGRSSALVAIGPLVLFGAFLTFVPHIAGGGHILETWAWIPSLGVAAAFRVDGLSLTFALLITGIGACIFLYASAYLSGAERLPRFYATLALFMASMIGAVLADDLVLLVVFWELTSLTSFLLIGYRPEDPASRRSAQQGFLITVAGGLAMLAGVIVLGTAAGTTSMSGIAAQGATIANHPSAPAIIILIACGAFAKSAQAPLHSWLANAMVAPTPVSAYLHSATMVKLGVYLLARLNPTFGEHAVWVGLLMTFGAITMVTGAALALRETDLKKILAYSTIASLGTLVLLIGTPGQLAAVAAMTFLIVHALYKACLFMVAGIIDHEAGTRDASLLRGLRQTMPLTAAIGLVGALSMAGLPPLFGFIGKELVYEAAFADPLAWLTVALLVPANAVMVVVAGLTGWRAFAGEPVAAASSAHDPGPAMLAGPALLAFLGAIFGLLPSLVGSSLILPAAAAVSGSPVTYKLALWHGFTPMLVASLVTLAAGAIVYRAWDQIRARLARTSFFEDKGPDRAYDHLMTGLQSLAVWQTGLIQNGSLRSYAGRVFLVIAAGASATLLLRQGLQIPSFQGVLGAEIILAALLCISAIAVTAARNIFSGIVSAGIVGFAVALVFLFQGAPDLAFTQFSVEALAIVIFLAIIGRMPFRERDYRTRPERLRDGAIALALGLTATLVMLAVISQPFNDRLSAFFRDASVPHAHGRNIVNVIIVDFRALDTLGEIAVLGLAALAAAAVLAGLRKPVEEKSP